MSTRVTRGIAVLGVCALWACAKGENKADSAAIADSIAKATAAVTPAPTPPAAAPLTDPNIVALADEANAADSAMGHLASTNGTSPAVKEFARQMMRDHHMLRNAGIVLVKKVNITPTPPANDTMPAAAQRAMDNLNSMAKGPDWDKAYIAGEIGAHQAVLALLQTGQGAATDTSLKALLVKATPTIEGHLKKAQDIAAKLNSAPAPAESAKKKTP
jgi:putative membrane protein